MTKKTDVRTITAGDVLSWLFGLLFFFSALGLFVLGIWTSGLVYLITSLLIMPPTNAYLEKHRNYRISGGLKVLIVIAAVLLAGYLTSNVNEVSYSASVADQRDITEVKEVDYELQPRADPLEKIEYSEIYVGTRNWDSDAEIDGPVIFLKFLDQGGKEIYFKNVQIPLDIEVYTEELDDFESKVGRIVYVGKFTMTDSSQGDIFSTGMRLPYEDLETRDSDNKYGIIKITATLPDGRQISSMNKMIQIRSGQS